MDPPRSTLADRYLSTMSVRVLLFATYADLVGTGSVELPAPPASTVAEVLTHLRGAYPGAAGIPERPLVAVNQMHARLDTPVRDGDELALLPPMAGG